ncbi:MarR family winged helix-turn-helix transcriptional regulator [Mycobacterium sp. MAA66]|uniref:MarR family winged helix-turn-helix transcriptional regulator n=1 Tax=Mycobacterium sp. MAA66 TaxID=3156297 RepID=UPI00351229B8
MAKTTKVKRGNLSDSPVHQLRRANQAVSAIWLQHLPDLTPPQFSVLFALSEHDELSQSELGALTSLDTSTLTALLDRLEGRDLISKTIDPANRRRRQISITATGLRQLSQAHAPVRKTHEWIAEVLGETEARQLVETLHTLADAARDHTPPT